MSSTELVPQSWTHVFFKVYVTAVYQSNAWNQVHLLTCPLATTAAASSSYYVCSHEHPWDLLYTCDGEDPGFFYPLTPQVAGNVKKLCGETLEQGYSQGVAHGGCCNKTPIILDHKSCLLSPTNIWRASAALESCYKSEQTINGEISWKLLEFLLLEEKSTPHLLLELEASYPRKRGVRYLVPPTGGNGTTSQ